jgi:hypothetical protein
MHKTIGIIVLSLYVAVLAVFAAAELLYQNGKARGNMRELRMAAALNPFISDYRYAIFDKGDPKDMGSIKEAIRLEPLKASYHMFYAFELLRDLNKRTIASDQVAFHEIKRAYELKPYSNNYRQIYEQYAKPNLGHS